MHKDHMGLAILYALLAAFFYTTMGVLVKVGEQTLPNEMVVFFRQLFAIVLFTPIFFIKMNTGRKKSYRPKRFPLYLVRTFSSIAATYCLFYAIAKLPLVDAILLSYTRPLFLPIVAYLWRGKRWSKNVWFGLLIGFLGVLLILKPTERVFDVATLVGLAAGFFGAIAFITIRRQTKTEPSEKILFYYLLLSMPITALPMAGVWKSINMQQLWLMLAIGLVAMLYQLMMTKAYQRAKAYKVASLLYSTVIFAALFDWWTQKQFLDYISAIGIALILIGSVFSLTKMSRDKKSSAEFLDKN